MTQHNVQTPSFQPATLAAVGMLALAVFLWAGNVVVGRWTSDSIPAFSLSFWRWGGAALILLPVTVAALWRQHDLYRRQWRLILALAFLNVTAFNTCLYWALTWIEASTVGIVAAAMPVVMFVAAWALGIERATPWRWAGLAVALGGVALLLLQGGAGLTVTWTPGEPILLFGVVCFGIYSVLVKNLSPRFERLGFLGVTITVGWVMIAPFYAADLLRGAVFAPNAANLGTIAYVAIFPSIVSNWFWLRGVQRGGPLLGALMYNTLPVFVCLLAVPLLGEAFTWQHAAGIALVLGGANLDRLRWGIRRRAFR